MLNAGDRIEQLRTIAERVRSGSAPAAPRPTIGVRSRPFAVAIPPLTPALRRARLEAAIAYLGRRGVLVSVVNRQALIRTYRVSGCRDAKLADEVVAIALEAGMDPVEK